MPKECRRRDNHGHPTANQIGGQRWQSIVLASAQRYSIATLLALDVAGFLQALGGMRVDERVYAQAIRC